MDGTKYQSIQSAAESVPAASKSAKVSVDGILNFIGFGPLQVVAFGLAGLTALAFGLDIVIFGFIDIPLQQKWNLTSLEYSVLPAGTGIANIIGGFFYSMLLDNFGRVWPYALILLNIASLGLASAFSPNFPTLVVLRFGASLAVTGAASAVFPTLLEVLPVKNRGKIMVCMVLVEALGICTAGGLAWWLVPGYPADGWRYLIIATSIPLFIAAAYRMVFSFQSPRYLIAKQRYREARAVFARMARFNGKNLSDLLPDDMAFEEMVEIPRHKDWPCLKAFSVLLSLFKQPYLRTTVCLTIVYVTCTGAFFGSSAFLPNVIQHLGINPYFTAFIGYCGQIPGVVLMAIIVEWKGVGRINAIRFFTVISIVAFLLFAFVQNEVSIPVFTILIYFSMLPTISAVQTYISEVYPTEIRSFSLGYFNGASALFNVFFTLISGYVAEVHISWLFPVVWAGVFAVQFIVSLFLNRETLGMNLTDTV